jgi:hypothetical protein
MKETYVLSIDVSGEVGLSETLELMERHGKPRIVDYVANGPAGGNPELTLEFDELRDAMAAYSEINPDGEPVIMRSMNVA